MSVLIGIDTGGTFTDFVAMDERGMRVHKELSTPQAPERAIVAGLNRLGLASPALSMVHGTTIATNALLEGKGARTLLVTNRGFADLLTIGRQARPQLYELRPQGLAPPVARRDVVEVGGRIGADGRVIDALVDADLERLQDAVRAVRPESVAVVLLFSFLDPEHERRIAAALPKDMFVSRSAEVLAERGEYERGITTWLNAHVGPRVQGYLARLQDQLPAARIAIMQSSGFTCDVRHAGRFAVNLLLSGPAGGLQGIRHMAALGGHQRVISLDMGGTSTDVALLSGDVRLTSEGRVGRYPVAVPMVDMHTIGAGGGSLARVDAGGLLLVGPESAGADPGPACYGRGNEQATVTDANVVLGRLPRQALLAGHMALQADAAQAALARLAADLETTDLYAAALGVVRVANENMAGAVRVISVQRGHDPRQYVLAAFGGAGGLHVCELAELLEMSSALVPAHAGVLSALGMLVAPRGRQLSRTLGGRLDQTSDQAVGDAVADLRRQGEAWMVSEGLQRRALLLSASLDVCYDGQSFTLNVPWSDGARVARDFHRAHEQRYGHTLDVPIRIINVRLSISAPPEAVAKVRWPVHSPASALGAAPVHGCPRPVPLYRRQELGVGQRLAGPAIVLESVGTTYVARRWEARLDDFGNLCLTCG